MYNSVRFCTTTSETLHGTIPVDQEWVSVSLCIYLDPKLVPKQPFPTSPNLELAISLISYEINQSIKIEQAIIIQKKNLLFSLEVLRWLDPEEVRQGSGHYPRGQVASSSQASHRIAYKRPHISHCPLPIACHCRQIQGFVQRPFANWGFRVLDLPASPQCLAVC